MLAVIIIGFFLAVVALGVLRTVGTVGKTQRPVTPEVAVAVVFLGILEILGLVYLLFQV